ncbi:hypothetical protein [Streptomyces sp. RFCAC02]|uniref:hypothetical protein n=1 Tax=Streptomyces sp. RFCAC02 TaxID=2499143 RepID=UPI001020947D|nr:hypothetical protein [Streptomyces sp. RFCAC02]
MPRTAPPRTWSAAISTRRPHHRTSLRIRLTALGGAALLTAATAACQAAAGAGTDGAGATREDVADAVEELLSWESLTIGAGIDATPGQVADYLARSAGGDGAPAQDGDDAARLLSALELTVAVGDPERERSMNDTGPGDPLDGAVTVNFGGRDVTGVKSIGESTYIRVGAEALVADVYGGDEAAVARAHRLEEDADRLPDAVSAAAGALAGNWTEVDPYQFDAYAEALQDAGAWTPARPRSSAPPSPTPPRCSTPGHSSNWPAGSPTPRRARDGSPTGAPPTAPSRSTSRCRPPPPGTPSNRC